MLLQDVRDNKTEAANAAPQALRLCQMVGSTASSFNTQMHHESWTITSTHTHAIAVVLPLMDADTIHQHECMSHCYMVFEGGGLSQTHVFQMSMMSISTVKVVCSKIAEQPVIAAAKTQAGWPSCAVCQLETSIDFLYHWYFLLRAPAIRTLKLHVRLCDLEHSLLLHPHLRSICCHSCYNVESVQCSSPRHRHRLSPVLYLLKCLTESLRSFPMCCS